MEDFVENIIAPIGRRIGTSLGAMLTGLGASAEHINVLVAAIPAIVGIAFDIALVQYRNRRRP